MAVQTRKPATEIIGKKTRRELQEYFVGTTLRTISEAFGDVGIECDLTFVPTDGGQRRCLVQQYYATLDFSKWEDARKFLAVYADVLGDLERQQRAGGYNPDWAKQKHADLLALIRKDGFDYKNGRLAAVGALSLSSQLKEEALRIDAPNLVQQIERIEGQVESDPRLAIGTSKELVETVCKTILADRGVTVDRKWELSELVKHTREELKLVPDDIPDSAKAAETVRKVLGNLAAIVQGIAELRNAYGTGHGHDGRAKGLSPRHARLAAGAACVLAKFLFETNQHRGD